MTIAIRIETCKECTSCKTSTNRALTSHAAMCEAAGNRDMDYTIQPKFAALGIKMGKKTVATYVTPEWCPKRIKDVAAFKAIV